MEDKEQKGFVVYGDYKSVIDELDNEQAGQLFKAMLDYFVNETVPDFRDALKIAFIMIKQQMDRDANKYQKKCEKNRENINKRWNKNNTTVYDRIRTDTNYTNTNTKKDKNKDKNKDTDKESRLERDNDIIPSLLKFMNNETGGSYKETDQFDELISGLLDSGYTVEDIRTVIRKKSHEWSCDGKMRSYLRPSVLFGDKFEEYLNAPIPYEVESGTRTKADPNQLREEQEAKTNELEQVSKKVSDLRAIGICADNINEFSELRTKQEVLQQDLDNIEKRLEAVT